MIRRRSPGPEASKDALARAVEAATPSGNGNGNAPASSAVEQVPRPPTPSPTAGRKGPPIGERLVARGLVTPGQLAEALLQQPLTGKRLGDLIVELGMVPERPVAEVLAEQLGLRLVDLGEENPDPEAVRLLPEHLARTLNAIPLRQVDDRLEVAVADPVDPAVASELLTAVAPQAVTLAIAAPSDIRRAIEHSYRALSGVESLVEQFQAAEALRTVEIADRVVSEDAPVVHLVDLIVTQASRDRASDIHIEPQEDRLRIRYRIDGALHDVLALPPGMAPALVSRIKIMANMNIVERRRPQDGQMGRDIDGRPLDIRISTSPTIWGEKAVLRLLDRTRTLYRLDELGMPAATHEHFTKLLRTPYGMVMCAGPTGSGKTTTLYATLGQMHQADRNIVTIEDPVEYVFSSINQIQINEQAGITFATGLRAILRQDPDVILVGEIRDAETARIAVESALTGHFVLSSIHATDASSALQRYLEMGIEPFLIASTVNGVVSQRLVRRICDQCREPYEPSIEEMAFYHQAGGRPPDKGFTQGRGCNFCARTGFLERVGVFELLRMTSPIKQILIEHASLDALREAAQAQGTRSLLQGGVELVEQGVTTIGEIISSIYVL
ncbi:MAG TPA: GspE/PulE family protein [Acidimicrobiales bacterium]|nr:GspE/PulE family protein [Acidimicrobiales bacterium]